MKRRVLKCTSVLLLLTMLNQVFAPSIAYALTAGPTSPEATSFEPIDTTDMVNPLTGNFTYNLPLLEVPGPEGGYPLSLSYHAGIQPNVEASWVGLGWTLNPGAINRNVNGYADDFSDVPQTQRDYWSGGERSTFGISLGLPLVSYGLTFSQDTYEGFGVGANFSVGIPLPGTPIGLGFSGGVDAYGNPMSMNAELYYQYNRGIGKSDFSGGGSVGLSTNFHSVGGFASGGISALEGDSKYSLLGASIGSASGKVSFTAGGGSAGVYNANAGRIQTESSGFGIGIPLPGGFAIGLSYNYTRYWSDESTTVNSNGSLYMPQALSFQGDLDGRTYDTYNLADLEDTHNIVPDNLQGGTFPDFDDYSVTGQGIGGSMRPYIYQSLLYKQNIPQDFNRTPARSRSISDVTAYGENMEYLASVQFRFVNDFSNSYRQSPVNLTTANKLTFSAPAHGNNDANYGFSVSNGQLAGSKHIVYYTNDQIRHVNGLTAPGFIDTKSAGFYRLGDPNNTLSNTRGGKQVGGFIITNASGVNYHYGLPAYEFSTFSKTSSIKPGEGEKFTAITRGDPFAYTWYLTAMTGPDYVDVNLNGFADDADWGYWVNFEYGKWSSGYSWRNPAEGFHNDLDRGYQSYSQGAKEVYYLDAIRTRTHTALFVKEIRADGKGTVKLGATTFTPLAESCNAGFGPITGRQVPTSTLKLKEIMLFSNDKLPQDLTALRQTSNNYEFSYNVISSNPCMVAFPSYKFQTGKTVIDAFDIPASYVNDCIRRIQFNYDYSLAPGTPNSFDPDGTMTYNNTLQLPSALLGKLTLLSVDFKGKGGVTTAPPVEFSYDLDATDPANTATISVGSSNSIVSSVSIAGNTSFKTGDIIKFTIGAQKYYCTLTNSSDDVNFRVVYNGAYPTTGATGIQAVKTKNPPYNRDAYDVWGLYKSDYIPNATNENMARFTSKTSNAAVDVWSLRKVKTTLGAELTINYEGDSYSKSVLNNSQSLIATTGQFNSDDTMDLTISNPQELVLSDIFRVNSQVNALLMVYRTFTIPNGSTWGYNTFDLSRYPQSYIQSVTGNVVKVKMDTQLKTALNTYAGQPSYGITQLTFTTANLKSYNINTNYGGGIRVKDIVLSDISGSTRKTSYSYLKPGTSLTSSGVTSYEPIGLDADNLNAITGLSDGLKYTYRQSLYKDINYLIPLAREVPVPGVMYENVSVSESTLDANGNYVPVNGRTAYQYRVFNRGMVGIHNYDFINSNYETRRNIGIKDYTSQVGNLIRVINYDDNNNKLSETVNHYLNDDFVDKSFEFQLANYEPALSAYNYQGVIQERYGKVIKTGPDKDFGMYGIYKEMSGKDAFPVIQTGTTQYDYKNGTKTDQQFLSYDYYSGAITSTLSSDSYGNRFLNEVTPAYRKYAAMGVKVQNDAGNNLYSLNMLTQQASNYTYKLAQSGTAKIGVVTASAQTWGNDIPVIDAGGASVTTQQQKIWRMKANYQWAPSGSTADNITPIGSFTGYFDGTNTAWRKTGEVTLYDVYSKGLESKDMNQLYSASHLGYNKSKVVLSGGPARYEEIAFAGAEFGLGNDQPAGVTSEVINGGSGVVTSAFAHTGTKSLNVPLSSNGFVYSVPLGKLNSAGVDYSASVWVKSGTSATALQASMFYSLPGSTIQRPALNYGKSANGWVLLEIKIPKSAVQAAFATGGTLTVGCTNSGYLDYAGNLYFDDFRFQPASAATTAFVYDNDTGNLSFVLNANNLYTKYEYDASGRLIKSYREVIGKNTLPLVKSISYNYGRMGIGTWVNTGVTRCQQINGANTGLQEAQQNDVNSQSPTFGQYRFVVAGPSTSCPAPIYARIEVNNSTYNQTGNANDNTTSSYGDVYIKFYSNAQCTIPYVPPAAMGVVVETDYHQQEAFTVQNTSSTYTYMVPAGTSSYFLGNKMIDASHYYLDYGTSQYYNDYYSWYYSVLGPANGYFFTPKPSIIP